MEFSDDEKNESKRINPCVIKLEETPEEQLEYFSESRKNEAVPREIVLPDPRNSNDD